MEDESKKEEQTQEQEKALSPQAYKQIVIKKIKDISNPNSKWTITQEILQDVMAHYTVQDPKTMPKLPVLQESLIKEIELRYKDQPELKQLLLDSVPVARYIGDWIKKDGWQEAVWSKIRVEGLFTAQKRAEVIEALRKRAINKSDTAAKIYLTLSGDYTEKVEMDNKSVDVYREINQILHSNRNKD